MFKTFDCTFSKSNQHIAAEEIIKVLETLNVRKYAFQEERGGKNKKLHIQSKFELKKKQTESAVIKKISELFGPKNFHISVTSNACLDDYSYVTKEESRVNGPWTYEETLNTLSKEDNNLMKTIKINLDGKGFIEPRKWQIQLRDKILAQDGRQIYAVLDEMGNIGKSVFISWMDLTEPKTANLSDPIDRAKDITRQAYARASEQEGDKQRNIFLIDIPKSTTHNQHRTVLQAVEYLKADTLKDDRYKCRRIGNRLPKVCCFMNTKPHIKYLSIDRWVIFKVDKESDELIDVTQEIIESNKQKILEYGENETNRNTSFSNFKKMIMKRMDELENRQINFEKIVMKRLDEQDAKIAAQDVKIERLITIVEKLSERLEWLIDLVLSMLDNKTSFNKKTTPGISYKAYQEQVANKLLKKQQVQKVINEERSQHPYLAHKDPSCYDN